MIFELTNYFSDAIQFLLEKNKNKKVKQLFSKWPVCIISLCANTTTVFGKNNASKYLIP